MDSPYAPIPPGPRSHGEIGTQGTSEGAVGPSKYFGNLNIELFSNSHRSPATLACVHVRLYHLDGSRLVCPCCECTPLKKPGACAKRTCECQIHEGPSEDFLPVRPVNVGPLRDVPLQRNLSTSDLR